MTKEEILKADEKTLQQRWIELMKIPMVYAPGKTGLNREYLIISCRLALIRGQMDEAAAYSEELLNRYGETLR